MMSTWTTNELKMLKDNNEECKWEKKIGKREMNIIAIVVVVLWYVDSYGIMMGVCGFRRNCGRSTTTTGERKYSVYSR